MNEERWSPLSSVGPEPKRPRRRWAVRRNDQWLGDDGSPTDDPVLAKLFGSALGALASVDGSWIPGTRVLEVRVALEILGEVEIVTKPCDP